MQHLERVDLSHWPLIELIEGFTGLAVEIVQTPKALAPERSQIAADAEAFRAEIERRLTHLDTAARRARAYLTAAEGDMLRHFKAGNHLSVLNALAEDVVQLFLIRTAQQAITTGAHRATSAI